MAEIITSGEDQNSYITLSEANALLLTMAPTFHDFDVDGDLQLDDAEDSDDGRYLIEAANDLNLLWSWQGYETDPEQPLAWPRKQVTKPGYTVPSEPGWNTPYNEADFLAFKILFLTPGSSPYPTIPEDVVPRGIKEAQALIAALRKRGDNLVGDSFGDNKGQQLGGLRIAYTNELKQSADIHKRTSPYGLFIGDRILRANNGE